MTFSIEREQITAVSSGGVPMGHIAFPRIRPGLVNINRITVFPRFRGQGIEDAMLEALLSHLTDSHQKAVLTAPSAPQYVARNPRWKTVLPGQISCVTH